jgi:murein L,D-transpeptidase YafK
VVDKTARKVMLLRDGEVLNTYDVALGHAPIGPKQREGDGRTPEGRYVVDSKNSRSHNDLALHVSYPDAADCARALRLGASPDGVIAQRPRLLGSLHHTIDWTDGCIAVTNSRIEEIWSLVEVGTPIEIKP